MDSMKLRAGRTAATALAFLLLFSPGARAHPYASGITNSSGTIRYFLNESADSVQVAFDNGITVTNLGAQAAGLQSFALGAHTNYSITVQKTGAGTITQISVDNTNTSFYGPRGVAVNVNPKTRYFGRVYLANANGGILNTSSTNKVTGRGLYVLNPDGSDALGRGTNALMGSSWGSSTTYAPFKCFVGTDDNVYVGDASGLNGSGTTPGEPVWMLDPDITVSNQLFVTGSAATNNKVGPCVTTPVVTGSLAASNLNLYCITWNYSSPTGTYNNVFKYSITNGPVPWSNAPTVLGNAGSNTLNGLEADLCLSPNGKLFVMQNHSTGTASPSVKVFDTNGTTLLWDSLTAGGIERLVDVMDIAVSPDNAFFAASTRSGSFLLARMTNGLPDLSTLVTNTAGLGSTTRGIAFDAADNIYIVTGGIDRLRVYSPGLSSTATTSNDATATNGTFSLTSSLNPPVIVTSPQDRSVVISAAATFTVTASGANPLGYQWTFNGTNLSDNLQLSGTHSNQLYLVAATTNNTGPYRAVVTNMYGAATSAPAVLTVLTSNPAVWAKFVNSPGNTNVRHDDVYFTDSTNGWASQNSLIYRTTNGGATWTTNLNLVGTHFRSVAFATPMIGFGGNLGQGSYDGGTTDTNVLYRTWDGGVTWSNVPGFAEQGMKGLCVLDVLDSKHIYGGGRVRGPAFFIKSSDGGTNWNIYNLTASNVMNAIMDVYFHDPTNGWAVGMDMGTFAASCGSVYHGRFARTTDGGEHWTPVVTTPVTCSYFWKMSWPSTNVGYVSLQQNGTFNAFIFYKTTDGGNNWVSNGIPLSTVGLGTSGFYLQGIGFVSTAEGWVGGASGTGYQKSYLHTVDGGATWTPDGYNNTYFMNRIRFLSPTLGYAAGASINIFSVPPQITTQPQSTNILGGNTLTLSVGASGAQPLGYQWRKNGTNEIGATDASLSLNNVSRIDGGTYSVIVTNPAFSLASANAEVRVQVPERLNAPYLVPGGGLNIIFQDSDGGAVITTNDLATFEVQYSSNFVNWTTLSNSMSVTNGLVLIQDTTTNGPARFYRVLEH